MNSIAADPLGPLPGEVPPQPDEPHANIVEMPKRGNFQVQADVIKTLEDALAAAKAGELLDVVVFGTVDGARNFYWCDWSYSTDFAKRVGLLTMALHDMQFRESIKERQG